MNGNLFLGSVTIAIGVAIQCFVVALLLRLFMWAEKKKLIRPTIVASSLLLTIVVLIMLAGNLLQIAIWARLFIFLGEFSDFATAFYHSTVNFTTLGYGDLVMSPKRRLLGALEAANGVLMFGLSSGLLFAVFSNLMKRVWHDRNHTKDR